MISNLYVPDIEGIEAPPEEFMNPILTLSLRRPRNIRATHSTDEFRTGLLAKNVAPPRRGHRGFQRLRSRFLRRSAELVDAIATAPPRAIGPPPNQPAVG